MKKGIKTVMVLIVVTAIMVALYLWYSQYVATKEAAIADTNWQSNFYDADDTLFDNADPYGFGF